MRIITIGKIRKSLWRLGLLLILVAAGLLIQGSTTAQAATMPDPSQFSPDNGQPNNMRILFGVSGTISVSDSYIKIYSTVPNPTINFTNISACNSTIRVVRTNSSQVTTTNVGSTTLNSSNCPSSFSWTLNGSQLANVGSSQYYVYIFHGNATSSPLTYMNMTSSNANFGYVGRLAPGGLGNDRFALQNVNTCPPLNGAYANCITQRANQTVDFTIRFGTHCDITSNTSQTLRWYDDDQNSTDNRNDNDPGGPGSDAQADRPHTNVVFDVYDETAGSYVVQNRRPENGNNQQGSYSMTFQPNHKYRWVWKNVADSNGLQFQLPYDSFFYNVQCDRPPVVVLDLNCDRLRFRVSDADGDTYDARLRWDGADTSSLLQNLNPGNSPGVNVYEFNIANRKDFGTHTVSLRVRSSTGTVVEDTPTATVGPCATVQCTGQTLNPSSPTPGEPVTFTQSISTDIGAQGSGTLYGAQVVSQGPPTIRYESAGPGNVAVPNPISVTGPNSGSNTVGPQSGGGIGPGTANGGNNESITWTITYPAAGEFGGWIAFTGGFSINCPFGSAIPVTDKPYLRVWGGDVSVGCDSSSVWQTGTDTGKILTFSRGSGRGAGTDLTVRALRTITQFSSSQRTSTADNYLTFANAGSGVPSPWGGNFGASCADSQYTDEAVNAATSLANLTAAPTTSGSYKYTSNGTATIRNWVIPDGVDITVYVDGDVTIAGQGANKAGVAYQTITWTSVDRIPSFKLIVRGNIKIAKSADSLSGTYVAQPRDASTGGTIYTCVPTTTTFYTSSATFINECNESLTIYGSFIAKNVKFLRVGGSTSTANASDAPGAGTAAEKFILSPELWLNSTGGSTAGGYDSLTSLPPVF